MEENGEDSNGILAIQVSQALLVEKLVFKGAVGGKTRGQRKIDIVDWFCVTFSTR